MLLITGLTKMFVVLSATIVGSHRWNIRYIPTCFCRRNCFHFCTVQYGMGIVHMSKIRADDLPKFLVSLSCLLILGFTAEDFGRKFCEVFPEHWRESHADGSSRGRDLSTRS